MNEEQKKQEFEEWQNRNNKWLHFQIGIGRIGEVIEIAFLEAIDIGFAYGIKAKVNTTTISDAPLMEREQLEQAKDIIKGDRTMELSGELDYRIRYDVEHDLFHAQNVFNDEYITPTFIEYVHKLEKENAELKDKNKALEQYADLADAKVDEVS